MLYPGVCMEGVLFWTGVFRGFYSSTNEDSSQVNCEVLSIPVVLLLAAL